MASGYETVKEGVLSIPAKSKGFFGGTKFKERYFAIQVVHNDPIRSRFAMFPSKEAIGLDIPDFSVPLIYARIVTDADPKSWVTNKKRPAPEGLTSLSRGETAMLVTNTTDPDSPGLVIRAKTDTIQRWLFDLRIYTMNVFEHSSKRLLEEPFASRIPESASVKELHHLFAGDDSAISPAEAVAALLRGCYMFRYDIYSKSRGYPPPRHLAPHAPEAGQTEVAAAASEANLQALTMRERLSGKPDTALPSSLEPVLCARTPGYLFLSTIDPRANAALFLESRRADAEVELAGPDADSIMSDGANVTGLTAGDKYGWLCWSPADPAFLATADGIECFSVVAVKFLEVGKRTEPVFASFAADDATDGNCLSLVFGSRADRGRVPHDGCLTLEAGSHRISALWVLGLQAQAAAMRKGKNAVRAMLAAERALVAKGTLAAGSTSGKGKSGAADADSVAVVVKAASQPAELAYNAWLSSENVMYVDSTQDMGPARMGSGMSKADATALAKKESKKISKDSALRLCDFRVGVVHLAAALPALGQTQGGPLFPVTCDDRAVYRTLRASHLTLAHDGFFYNVYTQARYGIAHDCVVFNLDHPAETVCILPGGGPALTRALTLLAAACSNAICAEDYTQVSVTSATVLDASNNRVPAAPDAEPDEDAFALVPSYVTYIEYRRALHLVAAGLPTAVVVHRYADDGTLLRIAGQKFALLHEYYAPLEQHIAPVSAASPRAAERSAERAAAKAARAAARAARGAGDGEDEGKDLTDGDDRDRDYGEYDDDDDDDDDGVGTPDAHRSSASRRRLRRLTGRASGDDGLSAGDETDFSISEADDDAYSPRSGEPRLRLGGGSFAPHSSQDKASSYSSSLSGNSGNAEPKADARDNDRQQRQEEHVAVAAAASMPDADAAPASESTVDDVVLPAPVPVAAVTSGGSPAAIVPLSADVAEVAASAALQNSPNSSPVKPGGGGGGSGDGDDAGQSLRDHYNNSRGGDEAADAAAVAAAGVTVAAVMAAANAANANASADAEAEAEAEVKTGEEPVDSIKRFSGSDAAVVVAADVLTAENDEARVPEAAAPEPAATPAKKGKKGAAAAAKGKKGAAASGKTGTAINGSSTVPDDVAEAAAVAAAAAEPEPEPAAAAAAETSKKGAKGGKKPAKGKGKAPATAATAVPAAAAAEPAPVESPQPLAPTARVAPAAAAAAALLDDDNDDTTLSVSRGDGAAEQDFHDAPSVVAATARAVPAGRVGILAGAGFSDDDDDEYPGAEGAEEEEDNDFRIASALTERGPVSPSAPPPEINAQEAAALAAAVAAAAAKDDAAAGAANGDDGDDGDGAGDGAGKKGSAKGKSSKGKNVAAKSDKADDKEKGKGKAKESKDDKAKSVSSADKEKQKERAAKEADAATATAAMAAKEAKAKADADAKAEADAAAAAAAANAEVDAKAKADADAAAEAAAEAKAKAEAEAAAAAAAELEAKVAAEAKANAEAEAAAAAAQASAAAEKAAADKAAADKAAEAAGKAAAEKVTAEKAAEEQAFKAAAEAAAAATAAAAAADAEPLSIEPVPLSVPVPEANSKPKRSEVTPKRSDGDASESEGEGKRLLARTDSDPAEVAAAAAEANGGILGGILSRDKKEDDKSRKKKDSEADSVATEGAESTTAAADTDTDDSTSQGDSVVKKAGNRSESGKDDNNSDDENSTAAASATASVGDGDTADDDKSDKSTNGNDDDDDEIKCLDKEMNEDEPSTFRGVP